MVDFVDKISDDALAERLARTLRGKGAFRRSRDTVYRADPAVLTAWNELRNVRAQRRAVEWLLEEGLVSGSW